MRVLASLDEFLPKLAVFSFMTGVHHKVRGVPVIFRIRGAAIDHTYGPMCKESKNI